MSEEEDNDDAADADAAEHDDDDEEEEEDDGEHGAGHDHGDSCSWFNTYLYIIQTRCMPSQPPQYGSTFQNVLTAAP